MSEQRNQSLNNETDSNKISSQLLQNQTILYNENQKLQDDILRLTKELQEIRSAKVNHELFACFRKEKENLLSLNETLKSKLRQLKNTSSKLGDKDKENTLKDELLDTINNLNGFIEKVKQNDKIEIKVQENHAAEVISTLTEKLEEEQRKCDESNEALRKLREDDEKYLLREKITDMKQLLTDLEVENTKLKYENEQILEDIENYKKQLNEAMDESKNTAKKYYALEDERDQLKQTISELENERIRIKKEMIEEMNEANRAKRVSVDTEIALQHISEAFENKRKEVKYLTEQLEDAEKIIKEFKEQFEPVIS